MTDPDPPSFDDLVNEITDQAGPEATPFILKYINKNPDDPNLRRTIEDDFPELRANPAAITSIVEFLAQIQDDPDIIAELSNAEVDEPTPDDVRALIDASRQEPLGQPEATPEDSVPIDASLFDEEDPEVDPEDDSSVLLSDKEKQRREQQEEEQQQQVTQEQLSQLEAKLDQDVLTQLNSILKEMETEKKQRQEQPQKPQIVINNQTQMPLDRQPLGLKDRLSKARQKFSVGKIRGDFRLNAEDNASILVLGKTRSGKSTLIKLLLSKDMEQFDRIILVSQTANFKGEYDFLKPKLEIIDTFDPHDRDWETEV